MPIFEYSMPDVVCSACTGTVDGYIELARKNKTLNPAIRAVNIDLTDEPPRAYIEVDEKMKKPCQLHFLPAMPKPKELAQFKDCYILINQQLYYVSYSGSTEPVNINDGEQFAKKLNELPQDEKADCLTLSLEVEKQLITDDGGFARLGWKAIQTELDETMEGSFSFLLSETPEFQMRKHLIKGSFSFLPSETAESQMRKHLIKGIIGLLTGSIMLGLCLSGVGLPMAAIYILGLASTALTAYLGKETFKEAFKKLKKKQFTMHTLFSISTLMALGVSIASFFVPALPMMFDTALLIFGFFHIGKAYEKSIKRHLKHASSYRSLAPTQILARSPGEIAFQKKLIHEIQPKDLIRVQADEVIGLDCIYAPPNNAGRSIALIDPYKGSNLPQTIQAKKKIRAGCRVPKDTDFIELEVTATEEDSYLNLLEKRSHANRDKKAPLETFASKLLQYFVPTVLVLAALSAIVIGILFTPLTAVQIAATILASACPCTLGLIIPLAVKIAYTKAVTQGVEFANRQALQAADDVDTVVFDVHGTLTKGEVRVIDSVQPDKQATNLSPRMLDYLAAIERESKSTHPIASAIQHYIHKVLKRPQEFGPEVKIEENLHSGIVATIRGETFIVGNKDLLIEREYFTKEEILAAEIPGHEAEHVIYLARLTPGNDKKIEGCILLTDPLRKEAVEVVRKLQDEGKRVCLCTGAGRATAEKYALKLGIPTDEDHFAFNCEPDSEEGDIKANSKTAFIDRQIKLGRNPAMVGDGLNDSRAFERCKFSIAIESATRRPAAEQEAEASSEDQISNLIESKAGAVIRKTKTHLSLYSILSAFSISRQTVRAIKRNLALSLSYNVLTTLAIVGLLVGIGFVLNPAIGAALMFIQSAFILTSLRRLKKEKLTYANDPILLEQEETLGESSTLQLKRVLPAMRQEAKPSDDMRVKYESERGSEFLASQASKRQMSKKITSLEEYPREIKLKS